MDECVSKKVVIKLLERLRGNTFDKDIPSPTIPEYRELHQKIQGVLLEIDEIIEIISND